MTATYCSWYQNVNLLPLRLSCVQVPKIRWDNLTLRFFLSLILIYQIISMVIGYVIGMNEWKSRVGSDFHLLNVKSLDRDSPTLKLCYLSFLLLTFQWKTLLEEKTVIVEPDESQPWLPYVIEWMIRLLLCPVTIHFWKSSIQVIPIFGRPVFKSPLLFVG